MGREYHCHFLAVSHAEKILFLGVHCLFLNTCTPSMFTWFCLPEQTHKTFALLQRGRISTNLALSAVYLRLMLSQFHINTAQDKHPECVLMLCELWLSQTSVTLVKQKVGCLWKVNTPLPLCIPGTAYRINCIFWPEDTFNLAHIPSLITKVIYRIWMIDDLPLSIWTVTRPL